MHIYHEKTFPLKLLIESSNLIDIDEFIIIITSRRRRNVFRSQLWNVFCINMGFTSRKIVKPLSITFFFQSAAKKNNFRLVSFQSYHLWFNFLCELFFLSKKKPLKKKINRPRLKEIPIMSVVKVAGTHAILLSEGKERKISESRALLNYTAHHRDHI